MKTKQFTKHFQKKCLEYSKNVLKPNAQSNSRSTLISSNYFFNISFDKSRLKNFVWWFLKKYGQKKTIDLLEDLKTLGFGYATLGGISLGIDDLKIPPTKSDLLFRADIQIKNSNFRYKRAEITGVEQFQHLIDTWHQTSEVLKQDVIKYFELTDIFNPVYMMAFSGARGNVSQVRQLVGMRGLMADPQGQIIDFPIRSNFREGLTLTEYIISTYGARKGIVDTALRTATAGYLTRRLVDVAQHVVVSQFDCGTLRGIFLFDMKEGLKTLYSFKDRLVGRVLAQDIVEEKKITLSRRQSHTNTLSLVKIASRNQEISSDLASSIAKITKKALVRSPLTCETRRLVCQLCYGWSLSKGNLVSLGEAVGVIAAQSIGEPGTQLTMRTFHTGGVFSGGLTDQIIAPEDGAVYYSNPIPGTCIRTPQGELAFLTKLSGSFLFKTNSSNQVKTIEQAYQIPSYTILFVRHQQQVNKKKILAQFSALSKQQAIQADAEQIIYSKLDGQIYFNHLDLMEQSHEKYGDVTWKTNDWAKIWILSGKVYENPIPSYFFPKKGDLITSQTLLNQIEWYVPTSCILEHSSSSHLEQSFHKNSDFESYTEIIRNSNKAVFFKNAIHLRQVLKQTCKIQTKEFSSRQFLRRGKFLSKTTHVLSNPFNFKRILQPNLNILSKRVIKKKFFPLAEFFLTPKSNFSENFFLIPNSNLKSSFKQKWGQAFNLKVKIANLRLPFYYPFQRISLKRLISFLYYGIQTDLFSSKKILNSQTFSLSSKLKKIQSKTKLSTSHLQKKWQPWFMATNFSKTVVNKTIQTNLQNQVLNSSRKYSLKKQRNNKILPINNLNKLLMKTLKTPYSFTRTNHQENFKKAQWKRILSPKKTFSFIQLKDSNLKDTIKIIDQTKLVSSERIEEKTLLFSSKNKSSFKTTKKRTQPKSNLLVKSALLNFSLQNLNYKKLSYILGLDKKENEITTNFSKPKIQPFNDFVLTTKVKMLTFFPLNTSFLNKTFKPETQEFKSLFSPHLFLTSRMTKNRHLELYNTVSWSNVATSLLTWFPQEYQTINNGIFLLSGLSYLPQNFSDTTQQNCFILVQKSKKSLKNCEVIQISKKKINFLLMLPAINYCQNPQKFSNQLKNMIFLAKSNFLDIKEIEFNKRIFLRKKRDLEFQKRKQNLFCFEMFNNKDWKDEKIVDSFQEIKSTNKDLFLINSALRNSFIYEKDSLLQFFKIKAFDSTIRWNNRKLITKSKKIDFYNYSQQKITKFDVNFNELFWFPQQSYTVLTPFWRNKNCLNENDLMENTVSKMDSIWDFSPELRKSSFKNFHLLNLKSKFIQTQEPFVFSLNRQGRKKAILSNLEGFMSINLKYSKIMQQKNNQNTFVHQVKNLVYFNNINFSAVPELRTKKFDLLKLNKESFQKFPTETANIGRISGQYAINQIQSILKKNLIHAVLNYRKNKINREKINKVFNRKCQQKFKNDTGCFIKNFLSSDVLEELLNQKQRALAVFPVQKEVFNSIQTKKSCWNNNKNINDLNNLQLDVFTTEMIIKQGWIYLVDDFSKINFLHHYIIEPGSVFLNHLCFGQHRIFIEILSVSDCLQFDSKQPFKLEKKFSLEKRISNKRSRFFDNKILKIPSPKIAILFRPMFFKILENPESYKIKFYKFQQKYSFSFVTLKKFYSNLLNQQTLSVKLISSFPTPDVIVSSQFKLSPSKPFGSKIPPKSVYLSNPLKKDILFENQLKTNTKQSLVTKSLNNEKFLRLQIQTSNFPPIFYESALSLKLKKSAQDYQIHKDWKVDNFIFSQQVNPKKKNSIFGIFKNQFFSINQDHFYGCFKEHSYYSPDAINFLPLVIQGSIPSNYTYLFKIPLVQFIAPNKLNSNSLFSNYANSTQLLHFLNVKNFHLLKTRNSYPKQLKSMFFNVSGKVTSQNKQNYNLNCNELIKKESTNHLNFKKPEISEITKADAEKLLKIQFLIFNFLVPFFEFSYSEKINYLYNQRFFDFDKLDENLLLRKVNKSEILEKLSFHEVKHSIPKVCNTLFLNNKHQQTFSFKPIAKTSFISSLEGEMILKPYNFKWPNPNSSILNLSIPTKQYLVLTKADLVTVYLLSPNLLTQHDVKSYVKRVNKKSQVFQVHLQNKLVQTSINYFRALKSKEFHFDPTLKQESLINLYLKIVKLSKYFQTLEEQFEKTKEVENIEVKNFVLKYQQKIYKINGLKIGPVETYKKLRLGKFLISGTPLFSNVGIQKSGQIIHLNATELSMRIGEYISASPYGILHSYNGEFIKKNAALMTLPFQTLKTGDIVQGIPKVEQYLEARTTQQGRLFVRSLPVLMQAIFERYCTILSHEKAVRQSFLKIQQILVDGVQRVYRSQGISIADKHLEIIVKQMTSKVQIIFGGQTGLFPGELVDLDFVERVNRRVLIKIYYEPIVLGITRASLEVESFLSAASFQQTTKILARAAIYKQKDYLKGLKENLLIGNLIPAGTGYIMAKKS